MTYNKLLDRNLNGNARTQAKKLSPRQMLIVGRVANKMIRAACPECSFKMRSNPTQFSNITDFCEKCQNNLDIIDNFIRLEKIYKKISK